MIDALAPGFAEPAGDAQTCFRLLLDAIARPGRVQDLHGFSAPAPLCDAAAALVLTLMDHETPLWLDPEAAGARAWIAFHTGAPLTDDPTRAIFAIALSLPASSRLTGGGAGGGLSAAPGDAVDASPDMTLWRGLAEGTDEAPETSATIILQVASLTFGSSYVLEGPGLRVPTTLTVDGLPADFVAIWQRNRRLFPRGIDLILCAGPRLAALPRSVAVREG